MKNNLLIILPIIIIFSLITGSFTYALLRAKSYSVMADEPILFTSSHQEKILDDLNKLSTIRETKELASKIVLKNIKQSNSINGLIQSRVKTSAEDLILLAWVFFFLFMCVTILTFRIYPMLKKIKNHDEA
ncbi:MAG: hypothetical protein P1U54_07015 [Immundisolibacteraceae bacterium]|nr:hypothetical protein [Immundisolibacteraceae bacterium]